MREVGLTIIGIGKVLKATVLLAAGTAAVAMASDPPHVLEHWAELVRVDPHNHLVVSAIAKVSGTSHARLKEIGVGTFAYAALFLVEGLGLLFKQKWAEWLTLAITASFVPFEVYEVSRHASTGKVIALVLNVAAVAYLVYHRIKAHRAGPAKAVTPDNTTDFPGGSREVSP